MQRADWMVTDAAGALVLLEAPSIDLDAADRALQLVLSAAGADLFLRLATDEPDEAVGAPLPRRIGRSGFFVNPVRARELRGDAYVAAASYAATRSMAAATVIALFRRMAQVITMLDDSDLDLYVVVAAIAATLPHAAVVSEKEIRRALDRPAPELVGRLGYLERRGILAAHPGGWTIAP